MATHSEKALATFEAMKTTAADWFHPAVKWVEEARMVPTDVECPDCAGQHSYRKAHYSAADAQRPSWDRSVRAFQWPRKVAGKHTINGESFPTRDLYFEQFSMDEARAAYAKAHGLVEQPCRRCYVEKRGGKWTSGYRGPSARVTELRLRKVMVGYILWPKGVEFDSRFKLSDGRSLCHCQLCGKGISKSCRVPLATKPVNGGHPHGMWVGQDCARKFAKVAKVAKPSKDENARGLESVLAENYEVPEGS